MKSPRSSNPLEWMARNSVAANLLMLVFLIGGYLALQNVKQEVFPTLNFNSISISIAYPGASPREVELAIVQVVEAEIQGIEGIKRVTSTAQEGVASITAELLDSADQQTLLQEVKNTIDRVRSFPEQAERPSVSLSVAKAVAMKLMLHGEQPEHFLSANAERVKKELMQTPGITLVEIDAPRPQEIAINIPESALAQHGLTLPQVAQTIRQTAQSVPAGSLKTAAGEVLIRIDERKNTARQFAQIPLPVSQGLQKQSTQAPTNQTQSSRSENAPIYLSEIAHIAEGFEDTDQITLYNGRPAIQINVYSVGAESPVNVAKITKQYVATHQEKYPKLGLSIFEDRSETFKGRINLLLKNAGMGLVLVLLILGFFLDARLAFWVMLGLPISILGAFLFFQGSNATINMVSLFAFIITIGIVVDDAIIVGEAIHEHHLKGGSRLSGAIMGAREMAMPVTFAVLTNLTAFLPLLFIPGVIGDIFGQIPAVVISVLAVSLIESLFILPAHLGHSHGFEAFWHALNAPQRWCSQHIERFIQGPFRRSISVVLKYRYVTLTCAIGLLVFSIGLVAAGKVGFRFLPQIDRDIVVASARLPVGSPLSAAETVLTTLSDSAYQAATQLEGKHIIKGLYATIGNQGSGSHSIRVTVSLVPSDTRDTSGQAFARQWRQSTPELAELSTLSFSGRVGVGGSGAPIQIELSHPDADQLTLAAENLASRLETYRGTIDIDNGVNLGKRQLSLRLTPLAKALGLTTADIAQQLRAAFFGIEALRQQDRENEIKVMVRLSEQERNQLSTIDQLHITTNAGNRIPLTALADISQTYAFTRIDRVGGQRVLTVTADVDRAQANLNNIIQDLNKTALPALLADYPQLSASMGGEETTRQESLRFLRKGMLVALLGIYMLLAVAFGSYAQPLSIMLSIPFGAIGALFGHMLLGYSISIISLIGIIGLTGIVINDALVLVVTLNRLREGSDPDFSNNHKTPNPIFAVVLEATTRRFRPIILTSLTTSFGLLPMFFETATQARFLIPMAISIGFGVVFATVIILALVPALTLIIEDLKSIPARLGFAQQTAKNEDSATPTDHHTDHHLVGPLSK